MAKYILSTLVENRSGVLTRISGLFARRGYNIDSLSVCTTEDTAYSRMTIVVNGDERVLSQIKKQLEKLPDVYKVITLEDRESVLRELLLVKIRVTAAQRAEIVQTAAIYKAKTIDLSPETMILELTGEGAKIDGFLSVIAPYGILEMARTGLTALHRGAACIKDGSEEV